MKIQYFSTNLSGQDYICSDIHGHFSLLEQQLEEIRFNPDQDRLFCLGDLIDRGDESNLVLDYLAKPWFFSILGNHELMLIDAFESESEQVRQQWNFWGGDWAEDFDEVILEQYYEAIVELPIAIELRLPNDRNIGLVHAELPLVCDWDEVKKTLSQKGIRDNRTDSPLLHGMLWQKGQMQSPEAVHGQIPPVENIDHVFHGHTIVSEIATISNRTFMDLGSYKSGRIGLIATTSLL